ncbi:MAG: hypothetical protein ACE5KA_08475 [Nitrososphaerales archaeon]
MNKAKRQEVTRSDQTERICYVCRSPLKKVKLEGEAAEKYGSKAKGKQHDVYVCEKGHTFSHKGLTELEHNEFP